MEEPAGAAVPPPLPPKTKPRSRSPFSSSSSTSSTSSSCSARAAAAAACPDARPAAGHVVKILINPGERDAPALVEKGSAPCIRISVNSDGMAETGGYFFFNQYNNCVMSSGQVSPSDTLDSGTCSDLDGTPPPPQKKKATAPGGVSVTLIGSHKRAPSSSSGVEVDSDDNESNSSSISCDSLNSGNSSSPPPKSASPSPVTSSPIPTAPTPTLIAVSPTPAISTPIPKPPPICESDTPGTFLPATLLQDIRQRSSEKQESPSPPSIVDEKTYEDRQHQQAAAEETPQEPINPDMFYNFHINERDCETLPPLKMVVEDETFAGYRDLLGDGASTIRSAKGTVRGVKNRVRAGIATFLQIQSTGKNYKEKEAGKVVVYTTTMGILRDTYQACMKVKQIMRTLLIKFEERDVFMSSEYQEEIKERMSCNHILVPQVFMDGQHIGDAETIERLNESGELRRILKPFKSLDACTTCQACGGYRLLPCPVCRGSKKSVHRNHFTTEFVALKCMNCDEVGLVKCSNC